jgi:hypothetical protein
VRTALYAAMLVLALEARAAPAPYLIETEFEPARAYVGAEVTLRLRLLRMPGVPYGVLRPPQFGDEADVMTLSFSRPYETRRAGTVYEVRERAYLVVPRHAGRLVLPGPEILGPLRQALEPGRDGRGAPRVLEVRPPRAAPGEHWLPARRVWLEESWSGDPGALAAGTPIVRTLVVRAEGISGNRLPRLEMAAQPGLSVHHDTSNFRSEYLDMSVAGRRVQRVVLMPLDEGEIELPSLSLPWWDLIADAPSVATLPGRVLRVGVPAAAPTASTAPEEMSPLAAMRWFSIAVIALCVITIWVHLRGQSLREARRQLREACWRTDPQAVRDALVEWWKTAVPGASAPLLQRIGTTWDARARAQLAALDAALYGAKAWDGRALDGRAWDGKAFWRSVRPWLRKRAAQHVAPASPALPPLFRLQAPQEKR